MDDVVRSGGPGPRLESWAFALDAPGLAVVLKAGVFDVSASSLTHSYPSATHGQRTCSSAVRPYCLSPIHHLHMGQEGMPHSYSRPCPRSHASLVLCRAPLHHILIHTSMHKTAPPC